MIDAVDIRTFALEGALAQLSDAAAKALLLDFASVARAKWVALANEKLTRTSQDYVRGIQTVEVTHAGQVASVSLVGAWPVRLEHGFPPFDMRDTLLGPSVPTVPPGERGKHPRKKGGFYRTIPFRLGSPTATGRNFQRVTDVYAREMGEATAKRVGRAAWKELRQQLGAMNDPRHASVSNPGEKTQWGSRLETAGTVLADVIGRSHRLAKDPIDGSRLVLYGGREHTASVFEGAYKMQQHYERATQAYYGTFRTISTAQPDGWIHPGYAGAHLLDEVREYVARVGPGMVGAALAKLSAPP